MAVYLGVAMRMICRFGHMCDDGTEDSLAEELGNGIMRAVFDENSEQLVSWGF